MTKYECKRSGVDESYRVYVGSEPRVAAERFATALLEAGKERLSESGRMGPLTIQVRVPFAGGVWQVQEFVVVANVSAHWLRDGSP